MKLVLIGNFSDNCSYSSESFWVFDATSIDDAEYALLEIQEFNDMTRDFNRRETRKCLDSYISGKSIKKHIDVPLKTFCGEEVGINNEYATYTIITLEEWVNDHTVNMV